MKWNLKKLLEIKKNILNSYNNDNLNIFDRYKYSNDLFLVNEMINYLEKNDKESYIDLNITTIIDTDYYKYIIDWINNYGSMVYLNIRPYSDEKVKTKLIYKKNCMFEDDLINLLKDFFKTYNPDLIPFLDDMLSEERILFAKKPSYIFGDSNCLLNFMSSGDSYIFQIDSLKLIDMQYLAKNIQNAYDFKNKEDILKQNTNLSPLALAKGRFAQYAFIDYLKQTKYAEEASVMEGKNLNEFFQIVDEGIGKFVVPAQALIVNKCLKNGKYNSYIKYILSSMQAYDWLNKYREDPDGTKKLIQEFDKTFGVNDLDIIKTKTVKDMDHSISNIQSNYERTRTLYR